MPAPVLPAAAITVEVEEANAPWYLDCLRRLELCGLTTSIVYDPNTGQTHKRVNYCGYDRCRACHAFKLNRWVADFSFLHIDFVADLAHEDDIQRFATLWRKYSGGREAEYCAILKQGAGARLFLREVVAGGLTMQRVQEVMQGVEGAYIKAVDPDGPTLTALVMEAAEYDEAFPFKVKRIRHSRGFFRLPLEGAAGEEEAASEGSSEGDDQTQSDAQVRLSSRGEGRDEVNPTMTEPEPKKLELIRWKTGTDVANLWWQDRIEDGWPRLDRWGDEDRRWWTLQAPADEKGEYPKQVPLNPRPRKKAGG